MMFFCREVIAIFRLYNDHLVSEMDENSAEQQGNAHQALLGLTVNVVYLSMPLKGNESIVTLVPSNELVKSDIEYNSIPTMLSSPIGAAIFKQTQQEEKSFVILMTRCF